MESLNPLHTREGIEEMKLSHADLICSRPWNQMEGEVLGNRVWGERERARERVRKSWGIRGDTEEVGERERVV